MASEIGGNVAAGENEGHGHRPERLGNRGDPFSRQIDVENGGVGPLNLEKL
jgi:hypothetical protein